MRLRVLVRLKPGILDVQGAAIQRALAGLGFADATDVRIGKVIEIEVDAPSTDEAVARAGAMCQALFVNPVLEDFTIETAEPPGAPVPGTAAPPTSAAGPAGPSGQRLAPAERGAVR
jgi:phosphoribosylformylglycinamidine synthase